MSVGGHLLATVLLVAGCKGLSQERHPSDKTELSVCEFIALEASKSSHPGGDKDTFSQRYLSRTSEIDLDGDGVKEVLHVDYNGGTANYFTVFVNGDQYHDFELEPYASVLGDLSDTLRTAGWYGSGFFSRGSAIYHVSYADRSGSKISTVVRLSEANPTYECIFQTELAASKHHLIVLDRGRSIFPDSWIEDSGNTQE